MSISTVNGLATADKVPLLLDKTTLFAAISAGGAIASGWYLSGVGAWAAGGSPGSLTAGAVPDNTTTGGLLLNAPFPSADLLYPYASHHYNGGQNGTTFIIADRVFHIGEFDVTTSPNNPYNGVTGTSITRPSSGQGIYAGVEIQTLFGAGASTITIQYTNQAGATGQTTSIAVPTTAAAGLFFPFPYVQGDSGINQVTSISINPAAASGKFNIVLYRPMFLLSHYPWKALSEVPIKQDWTHMALLSAMPATGCLWPLVCGSTTTNVQAQGTLMMAHG